MLMQIHIVPGWNIPSKSNTPEASHTHDSSDVPKVNLPHTINLIRLGPESRFGQPRLRTIVEHEWEDSISRVYRYNVIATKVLYFVDSVPRGFSYDAYFFTTHHIYNPSLGYEPGIYIEFDVTPYEVTKRWIEHDRLQLLVTSAGFLAGAFALVSVLEGLLQLAPRAAGQPQVLRALKKNRREALTAPEEPKVPLAEFPAPEEGKSGKKAPSGDEEMTGASII